MCIYTYLFLHVYGYICIYINLVFGGMKVQRATMSPLFDMVKGYVCSRLMNTSPRSSTSKERAALGPIPRRGQGEIWWLRGYEGWK
jgi:hypothetical protein